MAEDDIMLAAGIASARDVSEDKEHHDNPTKERVESRKALNDIIIRLGDEGDIAKIFAAERLILVSEREIAYEPSQASSIDAAIEDIDAALITVDLLRNNPEGYRILNDVLSHPKKRIGVLPLDPVRECCRAHRTRLQNYAKYRQSRESLETLAFRRSFITKGENSYEQEQHQVLGV